METTTRPHPTLYQLNTRVLLYEIGRELGRPATLDDISDAVLDRLGLDGFDWVWFLGVWRTGPVSRQVSLSSPGLRAEAAETLPDVTDDDILGSPFAIAEYTVRPEWGGDEALGRLRERLATRGHRLLLDFVPNHTGLDHAWVEEHPEHFIHGTPDDLEREPGNYVRVSSQGADVVLAHGRDPFFSGWPDTLQIDYRNAETRHAMTMLLKQVSTMCDGLRCDMAMLLQSDVFARTWAGAQPPLGGPVPPDTHFWREAIQAVRAVHPGFVFMAEVYWDREFELQQEGFDFTYDKSLYDRLRSGDAYPVREHLLADQTFQRRSVRFLENHDEPRAAATFSPAVHRAAAVVAFLAPGLRFFHEGEFQGRRVRVSMHVRRRPEEPVDAEIESFYERLLRVLDLDVVHSGEWCLHVCRPAWPGNETWRDIIVTTWVRDEERVISV